MLPAPSIMVFVNMPINNGVVAIFEVALFEDDLREMGDFVNVDKFIFLSGTVEIPENQLNSFNKAIHYVKHVY